jgi:hypothetical protein
VAPGFLDGELDETVVDLRAIARRQEGVNRQAA